jgi:hypothetical protein
MTALWTRVVTAALMTATALTVPSAQAPVPAPAPAQELAQASELADDLQRLLPTLDNLADFEKLLKGVEAMRAAQSACTPDASATSLGEALAWSVDASLQADRELARGRAAVDACRLSIAEDSLDSLALQSTQVTQLVNVFAALPPSTAPMDALDRTFEQTRWIALLRLDAVDLADLARELDQAGAQDPSFAMRLEQARRLIEISSRADQLMKETLSCTIASQPLAAASRIVATVQPVSQARQELDMALKLSKGTTCAEVVAAAKPAGPSWLPAPANAPTKQAAVAVPSWVPDRDTPATQTSLARSADLVGQVRDRLIGEETQRIEEQSRRYAEARTQRAADTQRAQVAQAAPAPAAAGIAMPAVMRAPVDHTQALAMAQRRVTQQIQQRERRRTSFLGVLGKVTAVVGAVAATAVTGGLAAPAISAILPTVNAVSAIANAASGQPSSLMSGLGLPLSPAAQQALAAAQAASTSFSRAPSPMPAVNPSVSIPAGGPTGYLAPTANEPFVGTWNCTVTNSRLERDGRRTNYSNDTVLVLGESNGRLVLDVETGAIVGSIANGRAQFEHTLPPDFGSCQMQVILNRVGTQLSGNTSATCPTGEQITGVLACMR